MSKIIISSIIFFILAVALAQDEPKVPMGFKPIDDPIGEILNRKGAQCSRSEWGRWIRNERLPNIRDDSDVTAAAGDYIVKFRAGKYTESTLLNTVIKHIDDIYPPGQALNIDRHKFIKNDLHVDIKDPTGDNNPVDVYVTYYAHSAGYRNRLSFYRKLEQHEKCSDFGVDEQCDEVRGIVKYVIFDVINTFSHNCFPPGYTVTRKLYPGKYGFLMEAQYWDTPNEGIKANRHFFSDYSIGKNEEVMKPENRNHKNYIEAGYSTSTQLEFMSGSDRKVFQLLGFEDQIGGDDDFNDVMFSIFVDGNHEYSDTPIYDDGVVKDCMDLPQVPQYSYVEGTCKEGKIYAYGFLERQGARENSIFYLTPTNGWEYFKIEDVDEDLETVLSTHSDYQNICFGFVNEANEIVTRMWNGNGFEVCEGNPANDFRKLECDKDDKCDHGKDDPLCINIKERNHKVLIRKRFDCVDRECVVGENRVDIYPIDEGSSIIWPTDVDIVYARSPVIAPENNQQEVEYKLPKFDGEASFDIVYVFYDPSTGTHPYNFDLDNYDIAVPDEITTRTSVYRYSKGESLQTLKSFNSGQTTFREGPTPRGDKTFTFDDLKNIASHRYNWDQGSLKIINIIHGKEQYEVPETGFDSADLEAIYSSGVAINIYPTYTGGLTLPSEFGKYSILVAGSVNQLKGRMTNMVEDDGNVIIVDGGRILTPRKLPLGVTDTITVTGVTTNPIVVYAVGRGKLTIKATDNEEPVYDRWYKVDEVSFDLGDLDEVQKRIINLKDFWSDPNGDNLSFCVPPPTEDYPLGFTRSSPNDSSIITLELNVVDDEIYGQELVIPYTVNDGCGTVEDKIVVKFLCVNDECYNPSCVNVNLDVSKSLEVDILQEINDSVILARSPDVQWEWKVKITELSPSDPDDNDIYKINSHMSTNLSIGQEWTYVKEEPVEEPEEEEKMSDYVFQYGSNEIYDRSFFIGYEATLIVGEEEESTVQCSVHINVQPSLSAPYIEDGSSTINEDETLYFHFDDDSVGFEEYTGVEPERRLMLTYAGPEDVLGDLKCCYYTPKEDNQPTVWAEETVCGPCSEMTKPSYVEEIIYTPRENDYGECIVEDVIPMEEDCPYLYEVLTFLAYDAHHIINYKNPRNYRRFEHRINVLPVNDAPEIYDLGVENGVDEDDNLIYHIEKGGEDYISFKVRDIDTLPEELTAFVRSRFSTAFDMFSCRTEDEDSCVNKFENGDEIQPIRVVNDDCEDQETLKSKLGDLSKLEECYAEFKFKFVPQKEAYSRNNNLFVRFTLQGHDGIDRSEPETVNYIVDGLNLPPTVASPEEITTSTKALRVVLDDSYVSVWDDASPILHKKMSIEMKVVEGEGVFIPHEDSSITDTCEDIEGGIKCGETDINSMNIWLRELRFEMESDEVVVEFMVNDGGYPNIDSEALDSEVSTTKFVYEEIATVPPVKNNSTLTIVAASVGAAAAVGLGLLVFFLRNSIKPPADDYFSVGADTVSGTPTNPIYSAQTVENVSPYYKGA